MLIPIEYLSRKGRLLDRAHYEKSADHAELTERLRKTLYYGKTPTTDRPSLPITEIAVEFLQDSAPRELGRVDVTIASNIGRRACVSPCSLMLGMIYVERLKHRNPEYLQKVSSSDLFLVSMMMASKYLYDEGVDEEVFNDEWAESAKMDIDELNALERNFLAAIDWNLLVQPEDFWTVLDEVEKKIAKDQGFQRGFYTYSDLEVLVADGHLYHAFGAVLLEICKVVMVCSVAYAAGAMTMVGSTMTLAYLRHNFPSHHQMAVFNQMSTPQHSSLATVANAPMTPAQLDPEIDLDLTLGSDPDVDEDQNTTAQRSPGSVSMTTIQDHWDPSTAQPPDIGGQRRSSLGMSGFLTLAIIKDTVVQFVMGVNENVSRGTSKSSVTMETHDGIDDLRENGLSEGEVHVRGTLVCKCGCCTDKNSMNMRCRNITTGYGLDSNGYHGADADVNRLSRLHTGHRPNNGATLMMEKAPCGDETDCQCCCDQAIGWFPWQQDLAERSRINQPFLDLPHGFGTTARAMVTG